MADGPSIGTAYLRVAGDFTQVRTQAVGLFRSSDWGKLGKAAGAGLAAGIAAGGVVKALYDIGKAFDDASDTIRTQTGATGKELGKLEGSFKKVVATVPTDFDSAAKAVAGLNQRLGLTGKPLTALSRQVTQLSKITGTDVQENVASITRLFGDWSIKTDQQTKTLDKLFRASQDTGISVSDLSQSMVQFGSPLRQLGIDFDHAAAMFGEFEQAGVNTQTLMPGLRFAIKAFSGGIATTTEDLKKWGVSMDDPQKALEQIMQMIKDAPNNLKANQIAFEVFGQRAGPDMAAAIREGHFELDDLIKSMEKGPDTIGKAERSTRDFSEQWDLFKNNLELAVAPAAEKVFDAIGDGMKQVTKIFQDKDMDWGEKFKALVDLAMDKLGDLVQKALELAPKVAGAFVKGFLDAPALAQLAVGGWLLKKFGGLSALRSIGGKVLGGIFGNSTIGDKLGGNLTAPGTTPARPLFVEVVNQLPGGGKPGAPGTPGGKPGPGGSKPTPTPTAPTGPTRPPLSGPGGAAGAAAIIAIAAAGETVLIGKLGTFLDKHVAPAGSGSAESVVGRVGKQMLNLRQQVKHLADEGKNVPAKMILKAGLDPQELKKAGVEVDGLGNAVKQLHKSLETRVKSQFGEALAGDGKIARDEVHDMLNTVESLPPGMQKSAAKAMTNVAKELHKGGQISDREMQEIRDMIGDRFDEAAKKGEAGTRKLGKGVLGNVAKLGGGIGKGMSAIVGFANKALAAFNVPQVKFQINAKEAGDIVDVFQHGGVLGARKGALVPGQGSGDKVPLHVGGRLAAMVEPGELVSVANRTATAHLMAVNKRVPRRKDGGPVDHGGSGSAMAAMLAMANKFEAADEPYLLGGGHGGFLTSPAPVDCSGFVSAVLHAGRLLEGAPMVSGALMNWGKPGSGPLTVYANPEHTFMSLDGKFYGTSRSNPNGGAGLVEGGYDAGYLSGFVKRTMDVAGMVTEIARVMLEGPDGPPRRLGQAILDKTRNAADAYIKKSMPSGTLGGGDAQVPAVSGSFDTVWPRVNPDLKKWQRLMGEIVGVESGGDPHAGGPGTSNPGHAGWFQYDSPTWAGDRPGGAPGWPEGPYDPAFASAGAGNAIRSDGMAGVIQRWTRWDGVTPALQGGGVLHLAAGGVVGDNTFSDVIDTPAFADPNAPHQGGGGGLRGLDVDQAIKAILGAETAGDRRSLVTDFTKKIKDLNVPGLDEDGELSGLLGSLRRDADKFSDFATRAAALNGDMPWEISKDPSKALPFEILDGEDVLSSWLTDGEARTELDRLQKGAMGKIDGQVEGHWVKEQLDALFRLRNRLIEVEELVEKRRDQIAKLVQRAQEQLADIVKAIHTGEKRLRGLHDDLDTANHQRSEQEKAWQHRLDQELNKKPGKQDKGLIADLRDKLRSKDPRRDAIREAISNVVDKIGVREDLRDAIKDRWLPEFNDRRSAMNSGRGTLLDELFSVQGYATMDKLKDLPELGVLGGEIFDAQLRLKDLGEPDDISDSSSSNTPGGMTISELLEFAQAVRYGAFDSQLLPQFHGGGQYRAPIPGGEGQATLRDREWILTPEQMAAIGRPAGGDGPMELVITNWEEGKGYIRRQAAGQIHRTERERDVVDRAGVVV